MKKNYHIAIAVISLSLVAACIPRGAQDSRIKSNSSNPQLESDDIVTQEVDWSAASVNRNANEVIAGEYTVKRGDTLSGIAVKTGSPQNEIASANALEEPFTLRVGQILQIPSGTYHRVSSGETGIAIARAYSVPWSEIVALNDLQAPYILRVGQRLKLPTAGSPSLAARGNTATSNKSPEEWAENFDLGIDDIVTGGSPALPPKTTDTSLSEAVATPSGFDSQFIYPLRGTLLSRFGSKGGGIVNDGINIAGAQGASIGAAADGVVVYSGNQIEVFGGLILVDHGEGWVTAYGHVGQINVKRGQKVKAGQNIGQVGQTGYVDRPQLHFEIRKDRKPVDPLTKLPNN